MQIDGRNIFGLNASTYDKIRPDYRAGWLKKHVGAVPTGRTALDIGCGTGKLGQLLASLGFDILRVEPDAHMATMAVNKGLAVETAPFESWDRAGRTFDVVACGQAWHWLDQGCRARKAAQCLAPRGRLILVWQIPTHRADVAYELACIYDVFAKEMPAAAETAGDLGDDSPIDFDLFASELRDEGFDRIRQEVIPWRRRYTASEWRQLISTESRHLSMPASQRASLLDAVEHYIANVLKGRLMVDYSCVLITATIGKAHGRAPA